MKELTKANSGLTKAEAKKISQQTSYEEKLNEFKRAKLQSDLVNWAQFFNICSDYEKSCQIECGYKKHDPECDITEKEQAWPFVNDKLQDDLLKDCFNSWKKKHSDKVKQIQAQCEEEFNTKVRSEHLDERLTTRTMGVSTHGVRKNARYLVGFIITLIVGIFGACGGTHFFYKFFKFDGSKSSIWWYMLVGILCAAAGLFFIGWSIRELVEFIHGVKREKRHLIDDINSEKSRKYNQYAKSKNQKIDDLVIKAWSSDPEISKYLKAEWEKRLEYERIYDEGIERLRSLKQSFIKELSIPADYCVESTIAKLWVLVNNKRANSITELLNLYESEKFKENLNVSLSKINNSIVTSQKQIINSISRLTKVTMVGMNIISRNQMEQLDVSYKMNQKLSNIQQLSAATAANTAATAVAASQAAWNSRQAVNSINRLRSSIPTTIYAKVI